MKLPLTPLAFATFTKNRVVKPNYSRLFSVSTTAAIDRVYETIDLPNYELKNDVDPTSQCYVPAVSNEVGGNLYYDTVNMLAMSQYVYTVAEMNSLARKSDDDNLLQQLETPKPVTEVREALDNNMDKLWKNDDSSLQSALNTLSIFQDTSDESMIQAGENSRILAEFEDDYDDISKSRVHGVIVNHEKKRVDIVFRGTANVSLKNAFFDWTTNLYMRLKTFENPCEALREKVPEIHLHGGFSKVLLETSRKGSDLTAFQDILNNEVKPLMGEGYRLYVTGHSLGGAVATLFGFFAACDEEVTKHGAVAIYSFASPRVGGSTFRETFKYLEQRGKLRHARFHNLMDIVPQKPYLMGSYEHVGLEMLLEPKGDMEFDYPTNKTWVQDNARLIKRILNLPSLLTFHDPTEMLRRIRLCQGKLEELSLEEEYRKLWGKE